MKRIIAMIIIISSLIILSSVCAFASPSALSMDIFGDRDDLIAIIKPAANSTTVHKKKYAISGACVTDVTVAVYKLEGNTYKLVKDDVPGTSGLFVTIVELTPDSNHFMLYVTSADGGVQTSRVEITYVPDSMFDSIKSFTSNFQSLFGGWMQ